MKPNILEFSPKRDKDNKNNNSSAISRQVDGKVISSFQKHEALVMTDNSNRFSEWPIVGTIPTKSGTKFPISYKYKQKSLNNKEAMSTLKSKSVIITNRETTDFKIAHTNINPPENIPPVGNNKFLKQHDNNMNKNQFNHSSPLIHNEIKHYESMGKQLASIKAKTSRTNTESINTIDDTPSLEAKDNFESISQLNRISSIDDDNRALDKNQDSDIMNSILYKAEQLLLTVSNVTKVSPSKHLPNNKIGSQTTTTSTLLSNANIKAFPDILDHSNKFLATTQDTAANEQINWLIRGLPEVYDENPQFDDEAVEALIKEGGPPPSELLLPSFYANNQRIMDNLLKVKKFYINIESLFIYSVKFGIRREGTYLLIHPPFGCIKKDQQLSSIMIPLTELEEINMKLSEMMKTSKNKRETIRNYFVGGANINRSQLFPIEINDRVLQEWIRNTNNNGFLRIELYSYIIPPKSYLVGQSKGKESQPVKFGSCDISLAGFACNESLDATVNCDVIIDASTHEQVINRMNNLNILLKKTKTDVFTSKMGTIKLRISLLSEDIIPNIVKSNYAPLIIPSILADTRNEEVKSEDDYIHSALNYVPTEYSPIEDINSLNSPSHVGIVIYSLINLNIPVDAKLEMINQAITPTVEISYKISQKQRDCIYLNNYFENTTGREVVSSKVYQLELLEWKGAVFEVWLDYSKGESEELRSKKLLLGLVKCNATNKSGNIITLPIIDVKNCTNRGELMFSVHVSGDLEVLEYSMQSSISMHTMKTKTSPKKDEDFKTVDRFQSVHDSHEVLLESKFVDDINLLSQDAHIIDIFFDENKSNLDFLRESVESIISVDSLSGYMGDVLSRMKKKGLINEKNQLTNFDSDDICLLLNQKRIDSEIIKRGEESIDIGLIIATNDSISKEEIQSDDISEDDSNKFKMNFIDSVDNNKRNSLINLLDVSVIGNFNIFDKSILVENSDHIFGTFVQYELPKALSKTGTNISQYRLWWDSDCAIMNGSNRHIFETYERGCENMGNIDIEFSLFYSDYEGHIPSDSIRYGYATLFSSDLKHLLGKSGGLHSFDLPIVFEDTSLISNLNTLSHLRISVSHRIEPILLRNSRSSGILDIYPNGRIERDFLSEFKDDQKLEINSAMDLESNKLSAMDYLTFPVDNILTVANDDVAIGLFVSLEESHFSLNLIKHQDKSGGLIFVAVQTRSLNDEVLPLYSIYLYILFITKRENLVSNINQGISGCKRIGSSVSWDSNFDIVVKSILSEQSNESKQNSLKETVMLLSIYMRYPVFQSINNPGKENSKIDSWDEDDAKSNKIRMTDQLLGTAVIDLSLLAMGISTLHGWYHIYDSIHDSIGQIKLHVSVNDAKTSVETEFIDMKEEPVKSRDYLAMVPTNCVSNSSLFAEGNEIENFELRENRFKELKQKMLELDSLNKCLLNQGLNNEQIFVDENEEASYSEEFESIVTVSSESNNYNDSSYVRSANEDELDKESNINKESNNYNDSSYVRSANEDELDKESNINKSNSWSNYAVILSTIERQIQHFNEEDAGLEYENGNIELEELIKIIPDRDSDLYESDFESFDPNSVKTFESSDQINNDRLNSNVTSNKTINSIAYYHENEKEGIKDDSDLESLEDENSTGSDLNSFANNDYAISEKSSNASNLSINYLETLITNDDKCNLPEDEVNERKQTYNDQYELKGSPTNFNISFNISEGEDSCDSNNELETSNLVDVNNINVCNLDTNEVVIRNDSLLPEINTYFITSVEDTGCDEFLNLSDSIIKNEDANTDEITGSIENNEQQTEMNNSFSNYSEKDFVSSDHAESFETISWVLSGDLNDSSSVKSAFPLTNIQTEKTDEFNKVLATYLEEANIIKQSDIISPVEDARFQQTPILDNSIQDKLASNDTDIVIDKIKSSYTESILVEHLNDTIISSNRKDETSKDDSPQTLKIKNLIDQEFDRLVQSKGLLTRHEIDVSLKPLDNKNKIDLVQKSDNTFTTIDKNYTPNIENSFQYDTSLLLDNSPTKSIVVSNFKRVVENRNNIFSQHKFPGKNKSFIDNETNRISNIMMGFIQKIPKI